MINYGQMIQALMQQGIIDPALFHGNRSNMSPVPPQATPAPEVEQRLEYMPPIQPAMPPLPTRRPDPREIDRTQGYMPAGGFGATGGVTSSQLEARVRDRTQGPDYKASGLWDALQRGWEFQPAQDIVNAPERGTVDRVVEQALMLGLPIGRIGAGLGAIRAGMSTAARTVPQVAARSQGGRAVRNYSRSGPWGERTELQRTLTDQLRSIHRRTKSGRPKDLLQGEALERRRQLYADPSRRARYQLKRKGDLDQEWGEVVQSGLLR